MVNQNEKDKDLFSEAKDDLRKQSLEDTPPRIEGARERKGFVILESGASPKIWKNWERATPWLREKSSPE